MVSKRQVLQWRRRRSSSWWKSLLETAPATNVLLFRNFSEFLEVGRPGRALDTLYEVFRNKKWAYNWSESVLEPIMFKYLELCVDLKKSHIAKEGLFQYRNMFQSVSNNTTMTVNSYQVLLTTSVLCSGQCRVIGKCHTRLLEKRWRANRGSQRTVTTGCCRYWWLGQFGYARKYTSKVTFIFVFLIWYICTLR